MKLYYHFEITPKNPKKKTTFMVLYKTDKPITEIDGFVLTRFIGSLPVFERR